MFDKLLTNGPIAFILANFTFVVESCFIMFVKDIIRGQEFLIKTYLIISLLNLEYPTFKNKESAKQIVFVDIYFLIPQISLFN